MKTLVIATILMCLVVPGIAANNNSNSSGESACAGAAHAHQYSDVRMAIIEVNDVTQCGFSFINLEENTVGMDNSFHFDHDFEVVRNEQNGENTTNFAKVQIPRKAVKKGMRAIAIYCAACKAIFSLKPYGNHNDGIITMSKR